MAGNLNTPSVIWNVGDTTGRDASGATVALPTDAVRAEAYGSGAPSGEPDGSPYYVDTDTRLLHFWDGSNWITVSGA